METLKHVLKPDQTNTIPPLHKDGQTYSDDINKANVFNNLFIEQTLLDDSQANPPETLTIPDQNLDSLSVTPDEVKQVLKSFPLGKAAGPDLINNRILKELSEPLSLPLCDLFNCSLSSGNVPKILKQANVTPIYKKNEPSDVSNYRPISLLSTVGKVLENMCINIYLTFFVKTTPLQLCSQVLFPEILLLIS